MNIKLNATVDNLTFDVERDRILGMILEVVAIVAVITFLEELLRKRK